MRPGILRRILSGVVAIATAAALTVSAAAATAVSSVSVQALNKASLLVARDGRLWKWGDISSAGDDAVLLTPVAAMSDVKEILSVSGGVYTSIVKQDGSVWGIYNNNYEFVQLTNANGELYSLEKPTVKLAGNIVEAYAWYSQHIIYAISADNTAYYFDDTTQTAIKTIPNVKELHPGYFNYIVKTDNSLWGWGDTRVDSWIADSNYPEMQNYTIPEPIKLMDNVASIDRCDGRTVGIVKTDGTLYGVGYGEHVGVPGQGKCYSFLNPLKIDSNVISVQTGGRSNLIYHKSDNSLWGIGENGEGFFNTGTSTYLDDYGTYHYEYHKKPQLITGDVDSFSISDSHIMILKKDGTLWAAGDNYYGALGDGSRTDRWKIVQVMNNLLPVTISGFSDVSSSHWAHASIMNMVDKGLFSGTTTPVNGIGTFAPDKTMSRAEFIVVVVRALYKDELDAMTADGSSWWSNAYQVAIKHGLVLDNELEGGNLTAPMSRQEMSMILSRACQAMGESQDRLINQAAIPDYDSIEAYYRDYVLQAYSKGMLAGTDSSGTFNPTGPLSRAQAATVLYRLVEPSARQEVDFDKTAPAAN